jgi:hypothetical protein
MGEKWGIMDISSEDVDWIYVAQDRDRCQTVANTVINVLVP